MDKKAAEAYIYAKASGIIGKSFVDSRSADIFEAKSLTDLWTLIFRTPAPAIPEIMLAERIEKEAFKRFVDQYTYFVSLYDKPDQILIDQLFIYESENLKAIGSALCAGDKECPHLINFGKFSQLNYKAWPDVAKITAKSPYSWYDHVPSIHEQQSLEFKIDLQVIRHLWKAIQKTTGETRIQLEDLYLNEYCIKNIVWALRLKINYKWDKDKIIENLIYVTDSPSASDPIAGPAIQIFNKETDVYEQWADWKYRALLNPHVAGEVWSVQPSWIERKNRVRMGKLASHVFHAYPMSTVALIGWYKMKNFEMSCIRTAVESLRMGISSQDAKDAVGIN